MNVSGFLEKVLYGNYDFCGLCYKILEDERTDISDEVILQEKSSQRSLKVSEILLYVLGEDAFRDMSAFESICLQCVTSSVNCYKFIKEAKDNVKYVTTAVENLIDCFDQDEIPNWNVCDTLFVTVHPTDLSIGLQYFDNFGLIKSKIEALEKFLATFNYTKPKQESKIHQKEKLIQVKQKIQNPTEIIKKKSKQVISTMDMVYNKDMSVLMCKECFREFLSVSNLRSHYLRVHAPKEFKCPECPKSFGSKSFLNAHLADSHINMICSECGKSFKNMQTFKVHERTHYLRIVCPDCGRVYKNQNTYKKHIENNVCQTVVRHSPADAKFTCDYCKKKYTQKMTLRVHIQYEHLNYKYHECKWCNKKFWCQSRLKAHIVKHTKEKNFVCSICGGKFVTKESLLYHTRIHTGERPYPCPFCDSRFLSASRRQSHLKHHHTDPTIECDDCKSKFKTVSQLIKHKYIHEHLKPREKGSIEDLENNLDLNKAVLAYPKVKKCSTFNEDVNVDNVQEQNVVYNIIDGADVYEVYGNQNEAQETVYLEMTEDGQYNIKITENI